MWYSLCFTTVDVLFHVEAVSLTCDNTTDVCPGTELTCTCSVDSPGLVWILPGSEKLSSDDKGKFTVNVTTDGTFVAVVTNNTGGVLESMLIYTATESLVNGTIECKEEGISNAESASVTITDTFAGKE